MPVPKKEINYKEFHSLCKEFLLYFEGYVRDASSPMHRIITLYSNLEEVIFGKIKTHSWV
ncbi:hypothetical protein LCGC14_2831440 [marine sediment metagenome]|uniref:Uncharacterized protein n=1 Tax=marine sediment metagenome TaxID=412755 RepID=A0A0F8YDY4_9ZZZZ